MHWQVMVAVRTMKLSAMLRYHEFNHYLYVVTLYLKNEDLYEHRLYMVKKKLL
jgi:hypothetical protein